MSTSARAIRLPPFVIADYEDGHIQEIPKCCPWQCYGEACSVRLHDLRVRKTGPCHPLAVLRCEVHGVHFTAYPPGFTPYARRALVEGPALHDASSLVEVVQEASEGKLWAREAAGGTDRWWSTQLRLLTRVEQLFGLRRAAWRQAVALTMGLALGALEATSCVRGVRARGLALHGLLQGLDTDDLLRLGAMTGCWGRPWFWMRDRQALVPLGGRDPPMLSTTSVRSAARPSR